MKESAKRSIDWLQRIHAVNFVNADEAIKTVLPTEGNCKRTIRRKKKSYAPKT